MTESYSIPVLFLIFNRPECTKETFEAIKRAKPKYLYVAADGPRAGKDGESILCEKTRSIVKEIDWDCEIKTLFRNENLGCGQAVSQAITWFFDNVEYGIILEDDCLPYPKFFVFCKNMLERYKDDDRIWEVCGTNLQCGKIRGDGSYYFSNYGSIWGWATWARAWKHYDFKMEKYEQFIKEKGIENIFKDKKQQKHWIEVLNKSREIDTWDYQWLFTHWYYNGLCVVPNVNLIKNIGFNFDGTHTVHEPFWYQSAISGGSKLGEIKHPQKLEVNNEADGFLYNKYYKPFSLYTRSCLFLKKLYAYVFKK